MRTLTEADGELFYKALALKLQTQLQDHVRIVSTLQARVAALERSAMEPAILAAQAEALAHLNAPPGATFNWQTLGWDEPA